MTSLTLRTIARTIGAIYLIGFVVGIGGTILIQSALGTPDYLATITAHSTVLACGAILWLFAVAGDAAHGVLMFPILKKHSESIAVGYLAARIMDALFVAIMLIFILIQIPLGAQYAQATPTEKINLETLSYLFMQAQLYTYQIAMCTLGASGIILCIGLYKTKLIPRWLTVWGLVGYITILVGMLSAIMGSGLGDIFSIPGGLWEVFTGFWLLLKGFEKIASQH